MRYFIHLAFDGTRYHGWQQQTNAVTVQETVTDCLGKLLRKEIQVTGCGRTDTGVHAKQFYLHFDVDDGKPFPYDFRQFLYKCNAILPQDIAFFDIFEVKKDAHARFDAVARTYQYFIHTAKDPFKRHYSHYLPFRPDLDRMNEAASILLEYNDFTSFSKTGSQTKTNLCKLTEARWETAGDTLVFTITADRFLRNMVRAVTGTLLEVGSGKIAPEAVRDIIAAKDRRRAGTSVPGNALFLTKVRYPAELFKNFGE